MKSVILAALIGGALWMGSSEPRIQSVTPDRPVVSPKAQLVTVAGDDFRAGLTLIVTTAGGAVRNLTGNEILSLQPRSFQVSFTFDTAGTYSFVVFNVDGGKSAPFAVQARQAASQPSIDSVSPAEFPRGNEPQVVTILGRNFGPGLRVSVTDPTGTVTVHNEFDKLEAQTAVLRLTFGISGQYALMVTSGSGESSNTVPVMVR